ncbi:protein KRI1 [Kluyveromyces marxianus DMKU3-1042]|uniref:Protein KRI1 n=1 Tax=Kluyveromyces marxianus (strain DMKU3-1042 / BCC 29191 / NBRC 104275) TaxID=1003335 RepID=W0TCA5_KLUMD|nr:protein KRI1 [Kluyveromyces marxianus DMKU3-1042]BAO40421.1 protein KRI1 [Kluyveromyces marxianus DMKU3-1042]
MPRKKSAAKKAREAAKKQEQKVEPVSAQTKVDTANSKGDEKSKLVSDSKKETVDEVDEEEEEESSSEDEDDFGELITEEVEEGIQKVMNAIKNNETDKLLNPEVKFFEEPEKAVEKLEKTEKHKPIYLKDYHRMNLLNGGVEGEDEDMEFQTVDGKQSFVSQQKEEKAQLLNEIKDAFKVDDEENEEDGDDDGDFLKKKETKREREPASRLPDPEVDDEKFLEEFVNQQAWIPKKGDKMIDLDRAPDMEEDDEEFEDAVEEFEKAYNFRYEDPNAAEIVSYARTQATLRRAATSSRRRKRDEERALKAKEEEEKQKAVQKKKKEKINQLTDVLEQVKKEYGADIKEEHVKALTDTLLNGSFEDGKWDEVIGTIFNDEFYNQEEKPTWNEDDEIMGEFYSEQGANQEDEGEEISDSEEHKRKKSKKEKIEEKKGKKKEKKQLQEMVEKAVDERKLDIIDQVEEERGRSKEKDSEIKFRYREVSPESFGLTTREIFTADDADLNEFIGLKKFAPYRPKELRSKDKRKVMKSRRLREWRKKVFKTEEGLTGDELAIPLSENASHQTSKEKERLKNKKRKRKD